LQDLVTVAYAVPGVQRVRWPSGSRRSPIAERKSLVAIAEAVLDAAGGSLAVSQLVAVFAQRFPAAVDLGDAPMSEEVQATATAPAEDRPDVQVVAAEQEWEAATAPAPRCMRPAPSPGRCCWSMGSRTPWCHPPKLRRSPTPCRSTASRMPSCPSPGERPPAGRIHQHPPSAACGPCLLSAGARHHPACPMKGCLRDQPRRRPHVPGVQDWPGASGKRSRPGPVAERRGPRD
jgi:hypothetical protein